MYSAPALPGLTRQPRPVIDPAAGFLVTDILADNNARARTFGLESALRTRGFVAVKTGTSKDKRDNWCIGFSDRFTIGVWIGNASGEAMHDVSGVSGAAPIWQALVQHLHRGRPSLAPVAPAGVQRARVAYADAREPMRDEFFITGSEPSGRLTSRSRRDRQGISSPAEGSIFALDPDMPPAAQRVTFEGEPGRWVLDGKTVGHGPRLAWAPWPGRHELQLWAGDGRLLQSVKFEVRGAVVKPAAGSVAKLPAMLPATLAAAARASPPP
jgi:penicillin-binding protein 1C